MDLKLTQPQMRIQSPSPANQLQATGKQSIPSLTGREPELTIKPASTSVPRVRPRFRPPVLLVCVIDDGGTTGEWIRLRADTFAVGRTEGDLKIPHDAGMSSRHFEFHRIVKEGVHAWQLQDVGSTNGTFVRVDKARLIDGRVIMLGNRRYRFDGGTSSVDDLKPVEPSQAQKGTTRSWQTLSKTEPLAELICLGPEEEGKSFNLSSTEQFIGSKPGASQLVVNDPCLDPKHAKIYQDERKKWWIADESTTNGTWVGVQQAVLGNTCEVLAGEQKFLVRLSE